MVKIQDNKIVHFIKQTPFSVEKQNGPWTNYFAVCVVSYYHGNITLILYLHEYVSLNLQKNTSCFTFILAFTLN